MTTLALRASTKLLIDGHNLALRCASAPALAKLTDRRGRSTGIHHGFLRSVAAFQEASPNARITVVFDGAPTRRKAMFADYKSNRPVSHGGVNPTIAWLKDTLPFMGVELAWNDGEEADDVIATMIASADPAERIVVVSTDRDFLQLVHEKGPIVEILAPPAQSIRATGKLYDVALVEHEYGVKPNAMVLLRAIVGDVSDTIPGARGIGPKIAAKLWRAMTAKFDGHLGCGAVLSDLDVLSLTYRLLHDGPKTMGPKTLTKLQCKRLLDAEDAVRRNVTLMTLLPDISVHVVPANPNEEALLGRLRMFDLDTIAKTRAKKSKPIAPAHFSAAAM
jgi:5'-3' exonuclease